MEKIFENFTITVLKLNKLVNRIKQLEMLEYGLKAIHVMCVYYLGEHPEGLTSSEMVKNTLEDKAAISRALKTLKDKGYVIYDANRHSSPVKLTAEGEKLAEFISEKSAKAVEAGSAELSEDERNFFYSSLGNIAANLEEYYQKLCKSTDRKED